MANPEHVKIVEQGAEAIRKWWEEHPDGQLDLEGANLSEINLHEADLHEANLRAANLDGTDLRQASLESTDLRGASLREAKLERTILHCAQLDDTTEIPNKWRVVWQIVADKDDLLEGQSAKIKWIRNRQRLLLYFVDGARGRDLRGVDLSNANLHRANLREANLQGANLQGANLWGANLNMADLAHANLREATLIRATLCSANLLSADLSNADLPSADVRGANLLLANLHRAFLVNLQGAEYAHHLETVRLNPVEDTQRGTRDIDPRGFDQCRRPWPERDCDWERLRTMGRLPLFGISYAALLLILVLLFVFDAYNSHADTIREMIVAWMGSLIEQDPAIPGNPLHSVYERVQELFQRRKLPRRVIQTFASIIFLTIASTLYTLYCPPRVKEFSRDQWCNQLDRPLIHYWPLAWKHRWKRLTCAACYVVGGCAALMLILETVWWAVKVVLKYTVFPWT
jgi:uncharacterized protein YjbI with pentapeptide repeats